MFDSIVCGTCFLSISACFLFSCLFVASLYIWQSPYERNHPTTIKQRFCSVVIVMVICIIIVNQFLDSEESKNVTLAESLGFRTTGLLPAMVFPLLLTMILFLGPLAMHGFSELWYIISNPPLLTSCFGNLIWIRNIIVAPITEEFTFRACMVPLLLQCYKPYTAVLICAFFFGIGHIHHMFERLKAGEPINIVILISCCEFFYTALFGAYSAFLFVRTGHFIAPVLAHAFCNIMGFPDFNRVFIYKNPKKAILASLFVAGIVFWALLLVPLTDPKLYDNTMFWKEV